MSYDTVGYSAMSNSLNNVNVQVLNSFSSESSVSGLQSAYSGFESLIGSVLESSNTTQASMNSLASGSYSVGMDVDSLSSYLSGDSSAISSYLGTSTGLSLPSTESLKEAFSGLDENSTVADFTAAWMKANYPDMSDSEIAAVSEQYSEMTTQMESYYAQIEAEYGSIGTDADGNADVHAYYMKFLDSNYPDMSAEEKESLCQQYETQYDQTIAAYEKAAEESGLNENSTLSDYFTTMIKKMNPDMSDDDVAKLVAAYEKNSEPLVEYYSALEDIFPTESTSSISTQNGTIDIQHTGVKNADKLLTQAYSMEGMTETANRSEINKITKESGIDCGTTAWCAAWAMNLLDDNGVLDTSGCSNVNYTPTITSWAKSEGIWQQGGNGYTPQAGDAIMFDWDGGRDDADHIGIVSRVEDGYVYTIEGNTSDAVHERKYQLSDGRIMGYIDCEAQQKKNGVA